MGVVGRFQAADFRVYPRDSKVICRTQRGLEVGTVLCPIEANGDHPTDGTLLRHVGSEDQLILERLEKFRDRAFQACCDKLAERRIQSLLVDVEHLFDGQSVYFYFLGEVSPQLEALTDELASTYDRKVRFKKFAETLAQGCGPDCGTGDAKCSSDSCGSCALAEGCGAKI